MRVSLFAAILAIAASVNGATIQERAVSSGVKSCIKDLNAVDYQLLQATRVTNAFNNTGAYFNMAYMTIESIKLNGNLSLAITSCGDLTSPVSKEESTAVLGTVGSVTPNAEALFSALVAKKTEIFVTPLVSPVIKAAYGNVSTHFATLDPLLVALTPTEDAATINAYVDRISSAYTSFKAAYGVV
ncbi:hypothetical protein MBANPS3_006512 [Mucor bainieri]